MEISIFFQQSEVRDRRVGRLGDKISHKLNLNKYVRDAAFPMSDLVLISQKVPINPNLMKDVNNAINYHSLTLRRPVTKNKWLAVQESQYVRLNIKSSSEPIPNIRNKSTIKEQVFEDSTRTLHISHLEGKVKPQIAILSFVGILLGSSLKTSKYLEGGMFLF